MLDRGADIVQLDLPAVQQQLALDVLSVGLAENAHRQLRSSCPHQSGYTNNFAALDMDVNIVEHFTSFLLGVIHLPVLHFKNFLPDVRNTLRVTVG
ncbi:hypothetical protein D3C77_616780 [compost metagenome]